MKGLLFLLTSSIFATSSLIGEEASTSTQIGEEATTSTQIGVQAKDRDLSGEIIIYSDISSTWSQSNASKKGYSQTTRRYYLSLGYLHIIDSFQLGTVINYLKWQSSSNHQTEHRTNSSIVNHSNYSNHGYDVGLGARLVYNFTDIQKDVVVPFFGVTALKGSGESNSGAIKNNYDGLIPGVGVRIFLNKNVACGTSINYQVKWDKEESEVVDYDSQHKALKAKLTTVKKTAETNLIIGLGVFI